MKRRFRASGSFLLLASLVFPVLHGCTPAPGIDSGDLGVSPGGQEDIAEARSRIDSGALPDPESITVEGFLSEHDIPLQPPPDAPEIYAAVSYAWRQPFNEAAAGVDIFVGLGSTIDISAFQRRPQNLAVVVDRSGSMRQSAAAGDYRTKMESVKQALHTLVDKLGPLDKLALISFNQQPRVEVPATSADQKQRFHTRIDELDTRGDTDLHAAIKLGFESAARAADADHDSRVIVFTDAVPTSGLSGSADFVTLQQQYADQGIGFTLMGVGIDYGGDLARDISNVRLGNAFYLSDADRISRIFNEEFDYFVTPAAFDLNLQVSVPEGVGIRDVFGVPDYTPGSRGAIVHVPTLFFSAREGGGAMVVRLTLAQAPDFAMPATVGQLGMSYTLRDGTPRQLGMDVTLPAGLAPSGDPAYFSDDAARRAALLLDTVNVLRAATQAGWDGRSAAGRQLIEDFLPVFDKTALGMSDRTDPTSRGLSDERQLLLSLEGALNYGYPGYPYYY